VRHEWGTCLYSSVTLQSTSTTECEEANLGDRGTGNRWIQRGGVWRVTFDICLIRDFHICLTRDFRVDYDDRAASASSIDARPTVWS
jgi:hypothetical protein